MRKAFRDIKRIKGRKDGFYLRDKNGKFYFDARTTDGIRWICLYLQGYKVILTDRSVVKMGFRNNVETWISPKGDDLLYEKAINYMANISF